MKNFYSIVFLLFTTIVFSQSKDELKPIYGQLVSDSISVKNVNIVNKTSKLETKTSADGSFTIKAKVKDTLYFNSANIVTMQYVVETIDFTTDLKVNVYPKSTLLDEIVIYRHNLTGTLGYDSRSLPSYYKNLDKEINDKVTGLDLTSEQQNSRILVKNLEHTMSGTIKSSQYDMDFVAIGKAVGKLFKKSSKSSERQMIKEQVYIVYGKGNLSEQLNMSTTEIDYYLDYLIANKVIDKNKVEKNDALSLLDILVSNKTGYYNYLQQEIK